MLQYPTGIRTPHVVRSAESGSRYEASLLRSSGADPGYVIWAASNTTTTATFVGPRPSCLQTVSSSAASSGRRNDAKESGPSTMTVGPAPSEPPPENARATG